MASLRAALRARVLAPVRAELVRGITPSKLALSLALGAVVSVLPVVGVTTALAVAVAFVLRLNQPAIIAANYAAYPLQLLLFVPFVEAGRAWFGGPPVSFSLTGLQAEVDAGGLSTLWRYADVVLRGAAAWAVVAPLATLLLYVALRPLLARLLPAGRATR